MTEKGVYSILLVDDEAAILKALQRLFRRSEYRVLAANSGREGLELLEAEKDSVALIISDQRMPEMNGAEFLERAKAIVPDAIRFLLTGYSELEALADSINKGEIHRYITKPWEDGELLTLAKQAVDQFQLKKENQRLTELTRKQNQELSEFNKKLEQKVLERTRALREKQKELEASLYNTVRSFASLLNLHESNLGKHGRRVSIISGKIAEQMRLPEEGATQIEIAALLHDIGKMGLSPNLINGSVESWTEEEKRQYDSHPVQGQHVVQFINRLANVGMMIRGHHERFDGQGFPDGLMETKIPLGARIIAIADAYDRMVHFRQDEDYLIQNYLASLRGSQALPDERELLQKAAMHDLKQKAFTHYDPDLVKILLNIFDQKTLKVETEKLVPIEDLKAGMVLSRALYSLKGHFLLSKNVRLQPEHIPKLKALYEIRLVDEKISIRVG
jgi:response regulator RpfG family c-di-GMP phosphodiesterase